MLTGSLHPYQVPAVDKFLLCGRLLVAFEMGLGKTVIAIAGAEELLGCADITTCLLVVPASLKFQWAQALSVFTDMPAREIRIGRKRRKIIVPAETHCVIIDGKPARKAEKMKLAVEIKPDYVIMSYEQVLKDTRKVRKIRAGMVVLDEASAIKAFGSQRTLTIKRSLTAEYRLALTATPIENKPEEAFSIMEWVEPEALGPYDLFDKSYIERDHGGRVERYKNLPTLRKKLAASMARAKRTDPEVRDYLPDVDHDQWYVDLDPVTRKIYDRMVTDLLDELAKFKGGGSFDVGAYYSGQYDESTALGKIMARQQAIEMLLGHPQLLFTSGSAYVKGVLSDYDINFDTHPKADYLIERVREILEYEENKILIFSRWLGMQDIITARLPGVPCVTYSGQMSPSAKAAAVANFAGPYRVFISSHAGAYGTDMKMANYLINYDLPWAGGTREQINGRHQRASSEFAKVYVRDIIMAGTIEERKLAMLEHKQAVAAAIIDGRMSRSGTVENDLQSLTEFLLMS